MISNVLVEVETDYINEYKEDDFSFVINDSIESVINTNREGVVLEDNHFLGLSKGDKIVFHHNITRGRYTPKGNLIKSDFWLEGTKYYIPETEIFLFDKGNGFEPYKDYIFITPLDRKVEDDFDVYNTEDNSYKGRLKNVGKVFITNKDCDLEVGDKVYFTDYSEHEFMIGNTLTYKMRIKDIIAKV